MHITTIIRRYLGWCPNAHTRMRTVIIRPDGESIVPAARGSFKDRVAHWLGLFRNQIFLFSLVLSATGFWMFAGLGGLLYPLVFLCGILTALPVSVYVGIWYWRIFNEVLLEGPVVLWIRHNGRSGILTAVSIAFAILPVLILFGLLPGVKMDMMITFYGGIFVVPFWGTLIAIQVWESETHKILHYDGMILEMETGRKNHVSKTE